MHETIPLTIEVMQPRRPRKGSHWLLGWRGRLEATSALRELATTLPLAELWTRGAVRVMSSVDMAELPDQSGVGPQWHVSITRYPDRPRKADVERALRDFGLVGAEEDNHEPGASRHFWRPLDAEHRVDCECKESETVVVEPDGHRWSNPHDPAECRGCVMQRAIGRACPLHAGSVAL